jgi:hypothetical protein
MSKTCLNCGRKHEGKLIETFTDGDNQPIEIVVCEQARHNDMSLTDFWRHYV